MIGLDVEDLVISLREYRGVVRKGPIAAVADILLPGPGGGLLGAAGEDAAALTFGDEVLLLAADGILEDLVDKDPEWAGYCSVLVNVNDIIGMGGLPVAMVNVLSCGDEETRCAIAKGMRRACDKFGVPMVGGHLHPDTSYTAVDVAVLGRTDMDHLMLSSTAEAGDVIIFAIDLDGDFTPGVSYSFDTTSRKTPEAVAARLLAVHEVAPKLTAGKDISNPGALGTLGMLLEASGKGAKVNVARIPRKDSVGLVQWLQAYQGCGLVLTCEESEANQVLAALNGAGLSAAVCGRVNGSEVLEIELGGHSAVLFDFAKDRLGCRPPQKI